jgi:hypothetical protein
MARAETVDNSDSEKEVVSPSKKKSTNGKRASMAPEDDLSEEQVDNASDAGSADGSEYEIESIISAKRNGEVSSHLSLLGGVVDTSSKFQPSLANIDDLFYPRRAVLDISSQLERLYR